MHWLKKHRKQGDVFKRDFNKSYDSITWPFFDHMLELVGQGLRMRKWIIWCVQTVSISIMINGSPYEPFKLKKGIRQGDPISPFLFTIISESLIHTIQ